MSRGLGLTDTLDVLQGTMPSASRDSVLEGIAMAGFLSLAELRQRAQSQVRAALVAGGAAGGHTVAGIAVGDRLVAVLHIDGTDAAEAYNDLTSEFSITATDTISNAGGTDTTGGGLVVVWEDQTPS